MCLSSLVLCIMTYFWPGYLACGILVPQPRTVPMPPCIGRGRVLTTGPPGKSLYVMTLKYAYKSIDTPSIKPNSLPLAYELVLVVDFSWIEDRRCDAGDIQGYVIGGKAPSAWTLSWDSCSWNPLHAGSQATQKKNLTWLMGSTAWWGPQVTTSLDHQAWEWGRLERDFSPSHGLTTPTWGSLNENHSAVGDRVCGGQMWLLCYVAQCSVVCHTAIDNQNTVKRDSWETLKNVLLETLFPIWEYALWFRIQIMEVTLMHTVIFSFFFKEEPFSYYWSLGLWNYIPKLYHEIWGSQ